MRSKKSPKQEQDAQRAIVFDVEKDKVVGVENEKVEAKDLLSLSSWAIAKKIQEIFTPNIDERHRQYLRMQGIQVRSYDELEDNELFQTFIFG
ncbi:MAG: hypothetical protein LBL81_00125 [Tannerella sp.]|nr:hypothetical protein [Tannerella sp.]